jgi:hypothetical protein
LLGNKIDFQSDIIYCIGRKWAKFLQLIETLTFGTSDLITTTKSKPLAGLYDVAINSSGKVNPSLHNVIIWS